MSWDWKPYVPVHERRARAKRALKKRLGGRDAKPIERFAGRKIARTFWGEAWCQHLESFSDYSNRLPRGRTYARNGSIVDLQIDSGKVTAWVSGSELYEIEITIKGLSKTRWKTFKAQCGGQISTLLDLLQGKVSEAVIERITDRGEGLFPSPKEINLSCSCPDWATMCKHVAATLYGVGVRLDDSPELFFRLRGVDHQELIESAGMDSFEDSLPQDEDVLAEGDLAAIFGVDFSDLPKVRKKAAPKKKRKVRRKPVKRG